MPAILRWLLRLGPANPVTARLVAGGSRRVRHLYLRMAYLGVLIAVLLYALLWHTDAGTGALSYRLLASAGATSFAWIAYLQIGLICVLAPVFMAGAIAQEADPRTWDILLTTPLSASQIVLGNLLGRLFFVLALLVSSLPLFAVTQYFGGVPGTSIFGSYAVAACAALLVGAAAIALSVSRLVGRRAVFAFYVGVISYLAVTIGADQLLRAGAPGPGVTWMTALNPFLALAALLDPAGYPRAAAGSRSGLAAWFLERPVTTWCVLATGLSVALTVVSAVTVRIGGLAGLGSARGGLWGRGKGGEEETHRAPRSVWQNPIAWREAASRNATVGRVAARWAFIVLGWALSAGVVVLYQVQVLTSGAFRTVVLNAVIGELVVVTLVAVNMSATAVSREREDGTLDLLLTTPITPSAYLSGKLQGIVAYLLPMLSVPVGLLLLAGAYVGLGAPGRGDGGLVPVTLPSGTVGLPAVLPEAGVVLALVAVPFTALCVMIGMRWSLASKGTIAAVMGTVGVVAVSAGAVGLCAWRAGADLPVVGPVLGALSPASVALASVYAEYGMQQTVDQSAEGLATARVALALGSLLSLVAHGALVYGLHAHMTRTFDMTVRRLAGTA